MRHAITSNLKTLPKRFFWTTALFLLSACGMVAPQNMPTEVDATALYIQAAATANVQLTRIAAIQPTATPISSLTPTAQPTFTPSPPFPLDGYIMLFKKDGDLYFQDGTSAPVQLTHGGEKISAPIISDDNQKVVFFRGSPSDNTDIYSNIYSVNSDGSGEQALITPKWLAQFGDGAGISYSFFIAKTHRLLFMVYVCGAEKKIPACANGLFWVDIDNGNVTKLVSPGEVGKHTTSGYAISPDGKMVSVVSSGHITIFDLSGEAVRSNIFVYTPSTPAELFPMLSWLPDSSGLIAAIPASAHSGYGYQDAKYIVWRYSINSSIAVRLFSIEPSSRGATCGGDVIIKISPDGNWILYTGFEPNGSDISLYIYNLNLGQARSLKQLGCPTPPPSWGPFWSPDSKHFIYSERILGSVDDLPMNIGDNSYFIEWLDANHYIYVTPQDFTSPPGPVKQHIGEIANGKIRYYNLGLYLLIKPKKR